MNNCNHPAFAYRNTLFRLVQPGTRWLDVGCGRTLLPLWLPNSEADQRALAAKCSVIAGLDAEEADNPFLTERHIGDASALPFPDESFDLVTAHMVVEHLEKPERFVREAFRVLLPGGRLVVATPNLHHYQTMTASFLPSDLTRKIATFLDDRDETDVFPTLYRFNTRRRIKKIAKLVGMEIESLAMLCEGSNLRKIPVLFAIDSVLVRLLQFPALAEFRPNLLAVIKKPC